jgi:hypothetical protein
MDPITKTGRQSIDTRDKTNWFLTHWRGEASLGISYWLNGVLLANILPAIIIAGYVLLNPLRHYLRTDAVVVLILMALQLTLWVWTVVGVIRSANRHTARGGKLFWANTARVMMCISVIAMTVRLERSLQVVIDASPNATTLVLNSDGGRETAAEELALRVRQRHLNTLVEDHCLSACTFLFLAGDKREVADDAELGFHQGTVQGASATVQAIFNNQMSEYYRSHGVRQWFIDRIVATPPASMWYPIRDELKEGGILN